MLAARQWLDERNISFRQTSEYQLKIGRINYYPTKGTIILDGSKVKNPQVGLSALAHVLRIHNYPV